MDAWLAFATYGTMVCTEGSRNRLEGGLGSDSWVASDDVFVCLD